MNSKIIGQFDDFIKSDNKNCLVVGTDYKYKIFDVIDYLCNMDIELKILLRISSMKDSEKLIGIKVIPGEILIKNKLQIYIDSFNIRSQSKTPDEFDYILVYPIGGLKGISDNNILDLVNSKISRKIFWISCNDNVDFSYLKLMCDISNIIEINNSDELIHKSIISRTRNLRSYKFEKVFVDNLSCFCIEDVIDRKYKLGGISSSNLPIEIVNGSVDNYIIVGERKTINCIIKAPIDNQEQYVLVYLI